MDEQVINEYYINLEYDKCNKEEVLTKISTLSKEIKYKKDDFSIRFLKAASIIEQNLSLFKSACEHIDIVTTILDYLKNFGIKLMFGHEFDKEYNKEEIILSVVLTILSICKEYKMQLFLESALIKDSTLNKIQYDRLKNKLSNQTYEILLLDNSDLYAVISYLTILGHSRINKIWIQESIKQRFFSLVKKYFRLKDLKICIWIMLEELKPRISSNMSIISIWSENIVLAKCLASFLDRDVIFLNMHMDLYGGVILLPWIKVFDKLHERCIPNFDNSIQSSTNEVNFSDIPSHIPSVSMYNLFYDGKWHKPVKGTYWRRNDTLWANATCDDVKMCLNSTIKGLKIWKTYETDTRMQLITQLIGMLRYNSNCLKGDIEKLVKWPKYNEISLLYSQNNRLEIIQKRIPRGIIILKAKTEEILLSRLIQILISGNSVIVLNDANSYSLAPLCDIFSSSKIPQGVINVLSNEDTSDLELCLCATDYANYEKQFFALNLKKTYMNLTISKQIVLSNNNFINNINDINHEHLICNKDRYIK